jgi:antitoxin VapB
MGVSIKSTEAERKLRRVSRLLGKSMTATVIELADGKLREIDAKKDRERRLKEIDAIVRRFNAKPPLTDKSVEEILGYNDKGMFD